MAIIPQNTPLNLLSFNGTEYLRQQMMVKNLEDPAGSAGIISSVTPGTYFLEGTRDMSVVDQPSVDLAGEFFIDKSYLANIYGPPGGYQNWVQIYTASQNIARVNEGYYPSFSPPETGAGLFGANPFMTVAQYYSPLQILSSVDSSGLLSGKVLDDSLLQQYGAQQLRKEFETRIAFELYQETVGRLNFVDAMKDPFMALDIVTGRESLIERDNTITVPKGLIGKGLDFVSRLTGVYIPFSYIPGDYFELEPARGLSTAGKIVSDITGILGSLVGIPRRRQSASQRFLEYTAGGTKSSLFKHIRYNKYGPNYGEGAQAQTAVGAAIGEAIDFIGGGILGFGNQPPNMPEYVGGPRNRIADMVSPPNNTYAGKNYVPIYGPDVVAKEFDSNDYNFGMKGLAYANQGNVPGGFTWYTEDTPKGGFLQQVGNFLGFGDKPPGPQVPGTTQGFEGSTDDTPTYDTPSGYDNTRSTNYDFREDSIMDVTQQIIDSIPKGGARLKSVSHAMNQVSKVFNDGYKELTKGSRIRRFVNSDPVDSKGIEQPREYCRIWTKDVPYYNYSKLQKKSMNHRFETYSVLDSPYNLNIAPWRTDESGKGSTNIVDSKVKKYMFSLENLAWRTSTQKGLTYNDLPACERGPNGGRIMWFPPYDLSVDEASQPNWTANQFVGRPEPIYTYNHTDRSGNLKFKIVVDHPSILNLLVRKELQKLGPKETDEILDSFFAGCKKYDIYDLARKWQQFSVNELTQIQEMLNTPGMDNDSIQELLVETNDGEPGTIVPTTDIPDLQSFIQPPLSFFFDNDYPDPNTTQTTSSVSYVECAAGSESKFGGYLATDNSVTEHVNRAPNEESKSALQNFFDDSDGAKNQWLTRWPAFAKALKEVLDTGLYTVILNMEGSASSIASASYNNNLSKRRLNSVEKMFKAYLLDGGLAFKSYMDNGRLQFPGPQALGESFCNTAETGPNSVYTAGAADCRAVRITGVEILKDPEPPKPPKPPRRVERPTPPEEKIKQQRQKNTRREIANKVLMKMVTECDYFDLLQEENEFIFDTLKEKFKFFHPAFHSMTPEGLNSRLTFLNQCVRPGATIPTKTGDGILSTEDAARNTAFGAPPICVLRVGDFYHTKIAIQQLSITYDDNLFDLNPEGIGVQPMIASVNITFNYIGGQGLKEPVNRLQNALSFNYYANTEMFDDRAFLTVTDDDIDEQAWLAANQDLIGQTQGSGAGNPEDDAAIIEELDTSENDGLTIGDRDNPTVSASGESGNIIYKTTFNDFNSSAYEYMTFTTNQVEKIMSNYGNGWVQLLYTEKDWANGEYYKTTGVGTYTTIPANFVGIPLDPQAKLNTFFDSFIKDIDNDLTYIQQQQQTTGPSNKQKRRLRNFLKEKAEEVQGEMADVLVSTESGMRNKALDYIHNVNRMNAIGRGCDGYITDGKTTVFSLSGSSGDVHSSSSPPNQPTQAANTLIELGLDYEYLTNVMTYYSAVFNGDISVSCYEQGGLCTSSTSSLSTPFTLTKPGRMVAFSSGTVLPFVSQIEIAPTQSNRLSADASSVFAFSHVAIDKSITDSVMTTNLQYFKQNYKPYINNNGSLWDGIREALEIGSSDPTWLEETIKSFGDCISINEDYFLGNMVTAKQQVSQRFAPEGQSNIVEGLPVNGDATTICDVKTDKERKLSYVKVEDASYEEIIRRVNTLENETNTTFNLKFK